MRVVKPYFVEWSIKEVGGVKNVQKIYTLFVDGPGVCLDFDRLIKRPFINNVDKILRIF